MGTSIRLERLIANLGYGSRKDVASAIKDGALTVNGIALTDPSARINPADLRDALWDDKPLDPLPPRTILLHKPSGYTCSSDEAGPLVYDLLPRRWRYREPILSMAGRLDKESTGLVLMTDDGQLLHKIISPKAHVEKHYAVTVCDALSGDEAAAFASGTFCLKDDAKPLKPAIWKPDGERSGTMLLQEGRYHQIRRMFGALGNRVETLHRFQIGGLGADDIAQGAYRVLEPTDIARLFAGSGP